MIPIAPLPAATGITSLTVLRIVVLSVLAGGFFSAFTVALNMASWVPLTGVAAVVGGAAGWAAAGWAWAYVVGRRHSRWLISSAATAAFLVAASVAYYCVEAAWHRYFSHPPPILVPGTDPAIFDVSWAGIMAGSMRQLLLWSVISVVVGPVLGAVATAARRRDFAGLLARLTLPVGVLLWSGRLLSSELQIQPRPAVVIAHLLAGLLSLCTAVFLVHRTRPTTPRGELAAPG